MEARNQSVDDLLLEIDQSIAESRHTMRYSDWLIFLSVKREFKKVIVRDP